MAYRDPDEEDELTEGIMDEAMEGEQPDSSADPTHDQVPEEELSPEDARAAMRALYGEDYPDANDYPSETAWADWARSLWERHAGGQQRRMQQVMANRMFRKGMQWLSPQGVGPWKEPPKSRDTVRAVHNMIAPALDQRAQIISEQRPGFRTKPVTQDPDDLKRAEAQQVAIEYQYDSQGMPKIVREATYHAGTDGVSFLHQYWNPDAGPWHEYLDGKHEPLGDLRTRVHRIEEVRVSANATMSERPMYWIIRTEIPLAEAVRRYGSGVMKDGATGLAVTARSSETSTFGGGTRNGFDLPGDRELLTDQDTVEMFTVYCERSEFLPQGKTVVVVGNINTFRGDLLWGCVPIIPWRDGSTDPAFYPPAEMEGWMSHQVRVNTLISKMIESIRVNSGGRLLTKPGVLSTETLIGGLISTLEVRSPGNINDAVMPLTGFSVGSDVEKALAFEIKAFEQKSGWNDTTRGSFDSGASGRAILAAREQVERIFAPSVTAAAEAMSEWAKVALEGMRFNYTLQRNVGVFGTSRPDQARALNEDDFDGVCDVFIDPETLMPMPRALRLFLLDQMYDKQQMTAQEYRRRMPFAWTRNLQTPDDDQEARARRVAEAIRLGRTPPLMRWQDNEAIHQDVLEREIILNDTLDEQIIQAGIARWTELANQVKVKQGGPPAPPGGMPSPTGDGPPNGQSLPPGQQPFLATSPGVAAAPADVMTGQEDIGGPAGVGYDFTSQV